MDIIKALAHNPNPHPEVTVIGDLMYDEHHFCEVLGISPEDDLAPKIRIEKTQFNPGGAANLALNLATMGAKVKLLGVVGKDQYGTTLKKYLQDHAINCNGIIADDRPTTRKTRFISTTSNRHICRVDTEVVSNITHAITDEMLKHIGYNLAVVSDYAKGTITDYLLNNLNRPYIVDPKNRDFFKYHGAKVIAPNEKELRIAANDQGGEDFDVLIKKVKDDLQHYSTSALLVTRGRLGSELFIGDIHRIFKSRIRETGDPTGCGDSAKAGLAYGLALGWKIEDACRIASAAGAIAVDHIGVYPVSMRDIITELKTFPY